MTRIQAIVRRGRVKTTGSGNITAQKFVRKIVYPSMVCARAKSTTEHAQADARIHTLVLSVIRNAAFNAEAKFV